MPYTNIVYVKFKLELLSDIRFTDQLDDNGKLVYMGLLLLAGLTKNNTPNDAKFIKRTLNLGLTEDEISLKIVEIDQIFPKFTSKTGKSQSLKFTNFNGLHNYVGKRNSIEEKSIEENSKEELKNLLHYFVIKYKNKTTKDYVINYGKDYSILKSLLKVLSEAEIKSRIDQFFEMKSDFVVGAGYTVGVFKSQINKLGQVKDEGVWGASIK